MELPALIEALQPRFGMSGSAAYRHGSVFGPHTLRSCQLFWLLDGAATWIVDGQERRLGPGTVQWLRPGQRHSLRWDGRRGARHGFVHLVVETPADLAGLPACQPAPSGWTVLAQRLLDTLRQRQAGWEASARIQCRLLLLQLAEPAPAADPGPPLPSLVATLLQEAEQRLLADPRWRLDLAGLARLAGCTPRSLDRHCRSATGHAPLRLLRLVRLELAARLLLVENEAAARIGLRCGFPSAPHFTRCFTRIWGRSPAAFRRHVRSGGTLPSGPLTGMRAIFRPHGAATPPP